jgi:UTP--glucose-1-phosphate uridylyltransferase
MTTIRKAVFPVAGLGTRFLPATKAVAKEMLTIVDKPLIQYAAEEAEKAGIDTLIFVLGRAKNSIKDTVPEGVNCVFIRQAEALGLGHAVLCAEPVVGNEPFVVILPDDLIDSEGDNCTQQMMNVYDECQCSVIGTQTINISESNHYGMVAGPIIRDGLSRVDEIIEKPSPAEAPSDQAIVGRYILTPAIFEVLKTTERGAGGEIQLTDGIAELRKREEVYAYSFVGKRYDCGSKIGYLKATVEYALKHNDLADEFRQYLRQVSV